jgi:WD40 repeat protein
MNPAPANPEELHRLLSALADGTLEAADEQRLAELLQADPAARAKYYDHVLLAAMLRREGRRAAAQRKDQSSPTPAKKRAPQRTKSWLAVLAASVLLALFLSVSEATGVTTLVPTIIRIVTGEGSLVIEVDDPSVSVSLDGEDITISGAGIHDLKLRPGTHRFVATKDGQPAHTELVTIQKGQRKVVTVTLEPNRTEPNVRSPQAEVAAEVPTRTSIRLFDQDTSPVASVAVSPNGKFLLAGRYDGAVQLLELNSGQLLRAFLGHSDRVSYVAFSPDGSQILTCGKDATLRLWNVETGQELRQLSGHVGEIMCVAFAPDGQRALSGGTDKTLRLWQLETGQELRSLKGHSGVVRSLAFSADGRQALSGSNDLTMKLWNVENGEVLRTFAGHETWVWSVAFSADGRLALSGSGTHNVYQGAPFDCLVRMWDVDSGELRLKLAGHTREITGVAFCSQGRYILSTGNEARLWDANTGALMQRFIGHQAMLASLATTADGRQFVTGSNDGTIRLWELPANAPLPVPLQR